MSHAIQTNPARRSAWIPWVFVGMLGLVIAVNGVLIWQALSTFTGVTVGRAYDRGRAYNDVLAEAARQERLGWQAVVGFSGEALSIRVSDKDGAPVPGVLRGSLERPLSGETRALAIEAEGPGVWRGTSANLARGQWEAKLVLTGPDGREFDIRERVIRP